MRGMRIANSVRRITRSLLRSASIPRAPDTYNPSKKIKDKINIGFWKFKKISGRFLNTSELNSLPGPKSSFPRPSR
jgi:hypothetical protein